MSKKNAKKLAMVAIATMVTIAILTIIFVSISILSPAKRSKAKRVDLDCVTELRANPLKECKNETKK